MAPSIYTVQALRVPNGGLQLPPSHVPRIRYPSGGYTAPNTSDRSFPPTPPSNSNESVPQTKTPGLRSNGTNWRDNGEKKRSTSHSGSTLQKLPTPDGTPPASLSPPQLFPSQVSPSVAESFRTARESPWLSEDDASSQGQSPQWTGDRRNRNDLGLSFPFETQVNKPTSTKEQCDMVQIPNREWDTNNLMRNVTIRPKKKLIPNLADGTNLHTAPSLVPPRSPRTPTFQDFNQKFPASISAPTKYASGSLTPTKFASGSPTPKKLASGSPNQSDKSSRRHSAMSSTSTVVEAIVVSTPPPKPRKLRHVSKTLSLRSEGGSLAEIIGNPQSKRALSESGNLQLLQPTGKWLNVTHEKSPVPGSGSNGHKRVFTDPLLRHRRDSLSLREEAENGMKISAHPGNYQVYDAPKANVPRSRSVLSGTGNPKTILANAPDIAYKRNDDTISNTSSQSRQNSFVSSKVKESTLGSQTSIQSHRSATHRALESALLPPFMGHPSTTDESLITILKRPSTTSIPQERMSGPIKHTSATRLDEVINSNGLSSPGFEDFLTVPAIIPRQSDASVGAERSELDRRVSIDRSTLRSEDHPRNLYSQTTPFSQMSDAPEVSEATAISIFPHNNHSLLLVQQASRPIELQKRQDEQVLLPATSEMPEVSFQPSTPPNKQEEFVVDSPLRNPRTAPIPPVINVLPATPMNDEEDPIRSRPPLSSRPTMLQRARRYSDTLIQPIISRTSSFRRRTNSQPPLRRRVSKDNHLHPFWHPRDFWDTISDSDSEWDDDDDVEPLPAGGDTSDPPAASLPRRLTQRLPGFRGNGGFLIGNSLNIERHGTNKRRHYIEPPPNFRDSQVALRDRVSIEQVSGNTVFQSQSTIRRKQSLSSLRSIQSQKNKMRRQWRMLGLHVEYVGLNGLRDLWHEKRLRGRERKAQKRRDEIRRSIGPKFLVENGPVSVFER
ncbi:hypothetical protein BT63DRAFT_262620 [Microthyrium microscopicum]|uniref:Uncharacterized protein n=1 Tax=Microthyrium microscopicum TaxID=703497 RepID=A0A6A6UEI5_9PEZI|nr:hypothetical protein BT63DRAFT_262620 [Microthyrium microscopicum]